MSKASAQESLPAAPSAQRSQAGSEVTTPSAKSPAQTAASQPATAYYQYDAIANRKMSADSLTLPGCDNYTANVLNQYTSSLHPSHQSHPMITTET